MAELHILRAILAVERVMQALKRSCGRKSRADAPFRSSADYVDREIPLLHRMFDKRPSSRDRPH